MIDSKLEVGALYRFNSNWDAVPNMWVHLESESRAWKVPHGSVLLYLGEEYSKHLLVESRIFLCGKKICYCPESFFVLYVKSLERIR
jgi:hypothetical protein